MARAPRVDVGDLAYHVINRANGRQKIFNSARDYQHFETLLLQAKKRHDMRIVAYVLMPNHWHLVLHPKNDGDVAVFMQWLTLTHTQQYHVKTKTIGYGHLYQGRYKSFIVAKDAYLLSVIKYVERNPVRAQLTKKVEEWKWGSGYRRLKGTSQERTLLSALPIQTPKKYSSWVNKSDKTDELSQLRVSVAKSAPYGSIDWQKNMIERFKLILTTRSRGRPKKGT